MRVPQIRLLALTLLGGVALSGCAYGIGDPYGGYGGVSVGYNSGYYGGGYGYSPYGYSGYGYGSPYGYANYGSYGGYGSYGYGYDPFGWYGNSYYPGTGIYVYDRHHHRRTWSDSERRHWQQRIATPRGTTRGTAIVTTNATRSYTPRENWSRFNRSSARSSNGVVTTSGSSRQRWQGRSSSSSSDTAGTTTRPSHSGWHSRENDNSNEK